MPFIQTVYKADYVVLAQSPLLTQRLKQSGDFKKMDRGVIINRADMGTDDVATI